jgi:DNA-damage-inducible protein D
LKHINAEGQEFWSARQLSKVLGYLEYRNFVPVIKKAKKACTNSGQLVEKHFVDIHEMVDIGSGAQRSLASVILSRYGCYLIVQNSDPSKEIVALGQTYFAVQTRKQGLIEQTEYQQLKTEDEKRLFLRNEMRTHNIQLAAAAKNAGVIEPV